MPSLIDMIINSNRKSKKNNTEKNKTSKSSKNTKKQKKEVEDYYDRYIKRYFGDVRIDNKRLDTKSKKSKSFEWGIGAEHEMHLFHITKDSKDGDITKSNILFDSQEATCFLLYDKNKDNNSQHCCKGLKRGSCYHNHMYYKKLLPNKPIIS